MYARTQTRKNNTVHCVAHWRGQFCCVFKCSVVHTWSLKILNVVLCADTVCCIPSVVLSVGMKNCTLCWHGMLYWYWVLYCALAWRIVLFVHMECCIDTEWCIVRWHEVLYSVLTWNVVLILHVALCCLQWKAIRVSGTKRKAQRNTEAAFYSKQQQQQQNVMALTVAELLNRLHDSCLSVTCS